MSQDRPSATNLLDTVSDFLETLLPDLDDEARFNTRVSLHLLGIVRRELEHAADFDGRERESAEALLGRSGELDDLNRELARKIRDGSLDARDPALVGHVLRSIEDKVRIVNPKRLGGLDGPEGEERQLVVQGAG